MNKKTIPTLGVASCIGGPSYTCSTGPAVLNSSEYSSVLSNVDLQWESLLEVSNENKNSLNILKKQSHVISQFTQEQFEEEKPFLVLGGDHSIAIGTWAGIMNQLPPNSTFALIWIDAHMDAHTLDSSPSGNLHGMPVSVLLGEAEFELQNCYPSQRCIDGRDLYLFGIRSYEAEELVLLSKNKVNVFDTVRIEKDGGTRKVLEELTNTISRCYDYYAISLDLDAIDPLDAPGVETRENTGLSAKNLLNAFNDIDFGNKFIGLEIAEFDPDNDMQQKTEKLVYEIINSICK
ncbi:MAG: arginase [endosymbiont of Galathealinum brachiosum]|uniref:Arginase n=1 Tax=endosymbiont of Galathealinum brachiosum TaxID=2200906 RepID=A0A370DK85_9GAMM|nr:MAG: arginase [endosymbiont of Galathealinum brachiosum]